MLAAVPKADLVVMNPTHYAVALKYDEATMAAPRVVAKGADLLAMRSATSPRTPRCRCCRRRCWRVRCTRTAEIDREIPAALFAAVAQVLAYVYQLRAALAGKRADAGRPCPSRNVPAELDPHNEATATPRPTLPNERDPDCSNCKRCSAPERRRDQAR